MEVLLAVIGSILILVGFVGIFAPVLPGIPLAWLGLFIYAIGTGFDKISVGAVIGFFIGMAVILVLDFLAPAIGARKYKASNWAMLGAFAGTIIGVVFFNVAGIIIGPLLGAFAVELLVKRDSGIAFKAALGTFVGFIAGALVKMIYLFILAGYFIAAWF